MAKARKSSSDTPHPISETPGRDVESRDRIAQRAYELYLARGRADGRDFDDWLAAERELAASRGGRTARGDAGE